MFNLTLYSREMKKSTVTLIVLGAFMTLYVTIIVGMYDPESMKLLDEYVKLMPEIMSAVGMSAGATTLIGFISSYLYGFILLVIPMIYSILRGNALIAKYADNNSLVTLVAAPVKRKSIAFTQMKVLATGIVGMVIYATVLEIISAAKFPDELDIPKLLLLNVGLLCLHLFIGGICFLASCVFNEEKYSIAAGAGVNTLMYILKMLANTGGDAENAKYFTYFTLFNPDGIIAGESSAILGIVILFIGAVALFTASIAVFCKKDLHI